MKHACKVLATATLALLLLPGCSLFAPDEERLEAPDGAAIDAGDTDFSRYVALGNSLSAGYQSGALYASAQQFSFTNLLAQAMGTEFEQPLIADPGVFNFNPLLGFGHLRVVFDDGDVGLQPIPWPAGEPALINDPALIPYNNLGVPGALLVDLLQATDAASSQSGTNIYFDDILRNASYDWTQVGAASEDLSAFGQALLQQPTFMSIWVGSNEFLGSAKEGVGAPLVDLDTFTFLFRDQLMGNLAALSPGTDLVLGNIPPVTAAPYFWTVPWFVVNPLSGEPVDGDPATEGTQLVGLLAEDTTGPMAAGDLVLLSILSYDSEPDGTPDIEQGLGIPEPVLAGFLAALGYQLPTDPEELHALILSIFPHGGSLIPGTLTLSAEEVQNLDEETIAFNAVIDQFAAANGIPVVDLHALFLEIIARDAAGEFIGMHIDGHRYTPEFVTGGIFSLDGIHPTAVGHVLVARAFVEAINDAYGSNLAPPSIPYIINDYEPVERVTTVPGRLPAGPASN